MTYFPHHEMSASHVRVACPSDDHVLARVYAHSGMVAYQGAKMSKSLGNLVFVSKLRESGVDPMAIRLALLAHHYRSDWEWTDAVLTEAESRLSRWRTAIASAAAAATAAAATASAAAAATAAAASATAAAASATAAAAAPVTVGSPAPLASPATVDSPAIPASSATAGSPPPTAEAVLRTVRERLADDLDAPGALAAIDAWADATCSLPAPRPPRTPPASSATSLTPSWG